MAIRLKKPPLEYEAYKSLCPKCANLYYGNKCPCSTEYPMPDLRQKREVENTRKLMQQSFQHGYKNAVQEIAHQPTVFGGKLNLIRHEPLKKPKIPVKKQILMALDEFEHQRRTLENLKYQSNLPFSDHLKLTIYDCIKFPFVLALVVFGLMLFGAFFGGGAYISFKLAAHGYYISAIIFPIIYYIFVGAALRWLKDQDD